MRCETFILILNINILLFCRCMDFIAFLYYNLTATPYESRFESNYC